MKDYFLSQEYTKDTVSCELIDHLKHKFSNLQGYIYYKFPALKELDEDILQPEVLLITPNHGLVAFVCSDINNDRNFEIKHLFNNAERIDTLIFSKLIKNKNLVLKSKTLKFSFVTLRYLPYFSYKPESEDTLLLTLNEVDNYLAYINKENHSIDFELMDEIISTLEASTAIIRPKEREIDKEDKTSKAYILSKLEAQIARFDESQRIAALSVLEGPQRIRGLAGSGKTIILCLKAANLHLMYPEKKILYTFYTKSLYDYIKTLISRFYLKLSDGNTPNFDTGIYIRHGWGGDNISGVYYDACVLNHVNPVKFTEAKKEDFDKPFDLICRKLLKEREGNLVKSYDYVLIDEAQDFMPSFYQLCRAIVKEDHLVWCYDELQNIFNVSIQNTKITFKNDYNPKGLDLKQLATYNPRMSNDIVLPRSYRNLKEILLAAHAIGFGIYNDTLIQSLENNNHWEDLGYKVIKGNCAKVEDVEIIRPDENSPLVLPEEYKDHDIIQYYSANNIDEETSWIAQSIYYAINNERLKADDIAVISLDDRNARSYFNLLEAKLSEKNISTNNVISKYYEKGFIEPNSVTLSSVYKAKGNEAAMVFVIGCDMFEIERNERGMRNKVFTSFTRAKVWLRISGIDIENSFLIKELKLLASNQYKLTFLNKPTHILQRDWDDNSRRLEIKMEAINDLILRAKNLGVTEEELIEKITKAKINSKNE